MENHISWSCNTQDGSSYGGLYKEALPKRGALFSQWRHVSDVTWLLSEPKNQRYMWDICLTICETGGIFCETMGGGVHQETETSTLSAAQTHTAYTIGVRPPGFEVFCIRKCGSTSNACFVYVGSGRILWN